jgi:hypothetical protein
VTAADFQAGDHWRVTISSFGSGRADGRVEITYPSGSNVTPFVSDFVVANNSVHAISLLVLEEAGEIEAQATWTGTPSNLALIINGPGQVGYYARRDGSSPLSVSYTVSESDLASGDTWRISLVSFSSADAQGEIHLTYP